MIVVAASTAAVEVGTVIFIDFKVLIVPVVPPKVPSVVLILFGPNIFFNSLIIVSYSLIFLVTNLIPLGGRSFNIFCIDSGPPRFFSTTL